MKYDTHFANIDHSFVKEFDITQYYEICFEMDSMNFICKNTTENIYTLKTFFTLENKSNNEKTYYQCINLIS